MYVRIAWVLRFSRYTILEGAGFSSLSSTWPWIVRSSASAFLSCLDWPQAGPVTRPKAKTPAIRKPAIGNALLCFIVTSDLFRLRFVFGVFFVVFFFLVFVFLILFVVVLFFVLVIREDHEVHWVDLGYFQFRI